MKNRILFLVFASCSYLLSGQVNEIGISLGGTNYVGDVGKNYYIYPDNFAGAVFYKFNYNPRVALRATYSILPIQGNDADADTPFRNNRGLSFTNNIHELALGIEFNFYDFNIIEEGKTWTPYLLLEIAAFNYRNVVDHPTNGNIEYGNKNALAIPFGFGFKSKLYRNLAFALESKIRYTFEDDLDFVSNITPGVNLEGTGNDWYMFTGFSLIYTFGRPPCYKDGF